MLDGKIILGNYRLSDPAEGGHDLLAEACIRGCVYPGRGAGGHRLNCHRLTRKGKGHRVSKGRVSPAKGCEGPAPSGELVQAGEAPWSRTPSSQEQQRLSPPQPPFPVPGPACAFYWLCRVCLGLVCIFALVLSLRKSESLKEFYIRSQVSKLTVKIIYNQTLESVVPLFLL